MRPDPSFLSVPKASELRHRCGTMGGAMAPVESTNLPDGPTAGYAGADDSGFRLLFAGNPHPMWVYDLETLEFLEVNAAAVDKYGYSRDEFLGMTIFDIRPPEDVPLLLGNLAETRGRMELSQAWRHRLKDGRVIFVDIASQQLNFAEHDAVLVLAQDVTEQRRLDEALRHQTFHDALTGLANRALFRDRVSMALKQRPQSRGECAILFIDLDGFKTINDAVGHTAGDRMLMEVAERLRASMRPDDTVARLGGDEFGVLLEHVAGIRDAIRVTERIMATLQRPVRLGDDDWMVSASIGIATSELSTAREVDELMRNADVAMYSAKDSGRGRFGIYEPAMHSAVIERLALENDLRNGLAGNQLRLHYQPQVDLRTGEVVAVEALVRWQHPSRGLVLPGEFILVAEDAGLIQGVDTWVLNQAAAQLGAWAGAGAPTVPVAINVSGKELVDTAIVGRVAEAIERHGIRPDQLEVEVTESATVETGNALEILGELRRMGVRVAIDDFGVGYSMLSRLTDFPLDKLKLDGSFIRNLSGDGASAQIVSGIIAMGHSLELEVLAEGVETEAQLEFLQRAGCDLAQGYLLSRPIENTAVETILRDRVLLDVG
jgi:diguanylate cyclase (GGDEF)-like protein/PAS domain S-box-containing protein